MIMSQFVSQNPDSIKVGIRELDNTLIVLCRSPMFLSGMTGFILDNIAPGSRRSRGLETFYANTSCEDNANAADVYDLPFKTNWKWTRYFPICPMFRKKRTV
ncbi:solute carrier family 23 member 1-like [Styela clava]